MTQAFPDQVQTFLALTGQRLPFIQAPIGSAATVALASAVARAGGMGGLALSSIEPVQIAEIVTATRLAAAGAPFLANFVLHFPAEGLDDALSAGVPVVTFSWGIDAALIARAQRGGARVGVQVGSAGAALKACDAGADFLIAQGIEAGGHVQSTTPLARLLPMVLAVAGHIPVVAAGGIASGRDIAVAIMSGAAGAMMGTRFIATVEAAAHEATKAALVAASADDTVFTNCFEIGWPHAMHRVLRNSTFTAWEAAGCPQPPHRPGEHDIVFRQNGTDVPRYSEAQPGPKATGDLWAACHYAGTSVAQIDRVEPAGDLVARLGSELHAALTAAYQGSVPA
jgi:nitronate monooxygenase